MKCVSDVERIVCAITSLGDVSWFEIASVLVLPALLGAVTLVVAIASLRIARASLKLSESIVKASESAAKNQSKLELINEIYRWIPIKWSGDKTAVQRVAESKTKLAMITANLDHSGFEGATQLSKLLWRLDAVDIGRTTFYQVYMSGSLAALTSGIVKDWLERPSSLGYSGERLDALIDGSKKRSQTHEKQEVKKIKKKIAKLEKEAAIAAKSSQAETKPESPAA